jgi:SAM-dependent methyltransferase
MAPPVPQTVRRLLARSRAHLFFRDLVLRVGRRSYLVAREDLVRRYLHGDGIEIGALDRPQRVPARVRVRYVDYLDKTGLIGDLGAALRAAGTDPGTIVDIDQVDTIDTLASFADDSLDFVIANHVLEHVEDPLGALTNVMRVLAPAGVAMLTLPDARHSFDAGRERTGVEHLRRDHREGPASSRFAHYEEWARLIEGQAEEDVPRRVAEFAAADARHHFHVWELETFLEFLRASGVAYDLLHAQAHGDEFAVLIAKPARAVADRPRDAS